MSEIKEGYKQTKVGVIPEEWEVVKIGNVLTIGSGKDYKHLSDGDIPVYGTGGYILSVNKYLYDGKSVCIGRKGTIDKPMFLNGKFWTVDTLFYTHSYKNSMPKFLYFTFLQINWKKYNEASGVPSLSKKTIELINIPLPPLKEQQKIAEILTTWDDAISKQEELIKAKEELKKGLMQKLLSGEVRFEEFGVGTLVPLKDSDIYNNGTKVPAPDGWKVVRLGDIATFHKGKGISKNDISEIGIECIRYGELYTKYDESIDKIYSKTSLQKNDLVLSKENDILIPASGETAIDLATASCVLKKDIALGGDINIIRADANGIFLSYYLNTIAKIKIASLAQGVSVIHLYSSQLKSLKIHLPPLKEQQTIAQVLSTADKEIELLKNELESLKEQKKGLMQRLLTGEARVNLWQ